jgi:hypothetical protein
MRPASQSQKVLDFTYGIPRQLTRPDDVRAIVIVAMDAWLIQFEAWQSYVRALADLTDRRIVLLAPKPPDAQSAQVFPALEHKLTEIFSPTDSPERFVRFPDSPNALTRELREVLPAACGRMAGFRLASERPTLPIFTKKIEP